MRIADYAFSGTVLSSATLSNRLMFIGDYAFKDCNALSFFDVQDADGQPLGSGSKYFADRNQNAELYQPGAASGYRYETLVRDVLRANRCVFVWRGKGDHDIWCNPATDRHFRSTAKLNPGI